MPLFSIPKLRTRGRSVESRQAPNTTKPTPQQNNERSVSVPPQRSKSSGRSVSSKASLGSMSGGFRSKSSTRSRASSTRSPTMDYSYSYDGEVPTNASNGGKAKRVGSASVSGSMGSKATQKASNSISANNYANKSSNNGSSARYTFAEPAAPQSNNHNNSKRLGYESDGNTSFLSGETSDGEFVTSLDRSPPKLEDLFLEEGVFGRLVGPDSNTAATPAANSGGATQHDAEFHDPPDIIPSSDDENEPGIDHNYSGSVFSVDTDPNGSFDNTKAGSFTDFNQEWITFDSANTPTAPSSGGEWPSPPPQPQKQTLQKKKEQQQGEWDTPPSRSTKNPRLVSPDTAQKASVQHDGEKAIESMSSKDVDFLAWGMQQEFPATPASREMKEVQVKPASSFGANFFENGFNDGFSDDKDAFFGSGWTEMNNGSVSNDKSSGNHKNNQFPNKMDDNMTWDEPAQFFEEKKDDTIWSSPSPPMTRKEVSKHSSSPGMSSVSSLTVPVTPVEPTPSFGNSSKGPTHADNQFLSFETFDGLQPAVSSSSSTRRFPPTSPPNKTGTTQPRHRRVPSNGSTNSQQQLHRGTSRKKGGGSVGSNSSAVDQILEQYRQKRLAKQQQQQGGSSVSSQNHLPPHNSHKRTPSNESLSRAIGNLENSIASKNHVAAAAPVPRAQQHLSQPQPYNQISSAATGRASPQSSISYSRTGSGFQPSLNAAVNEISDRLRVQRRGLNTSATEESCPANPSSDSDQFLLQEVEATIGPRGVAPDMESLSGRSNRSSQYRHGRSSPRSHLHRSRGDAASVDSRTSRTSRNSFRSYRSNISASVLSHMSKESQSVANDLFRLEAQLAEVARQQDQPLENETEESHSRDVVYGSMSEGSMRSNHGITIIGAEPFPRPNLVEVVAPPGKLGILLSNKSGNLGPTHVSAVRSESVLAGKVHVGDRFASIDGEDVSGMNSREITAVMASKAHFQRVIVFVPVQRAIAAQDEWI